MKSTLLLSIALVFAFASCKKDSDKNGDINQGSFYGKVVINGDTIELKQALVGYTNGVGSGGGVIDTAGNYLFRQFTEFGSANDTLRIYFIDVFATEPTAAQKEATVRTGNYNTGYGTLNAIAPDANLKAGAAVVYIDSMGTFWTTDKDPENQPNWAFNVSSHTANTNDGFSKYITKLTFTVRLHNPLTGDQIEATALKMTARTVIP
jgi:hypothetical protein